MRGICLSPKLGPVLPTMSQAPENSHKRQDSLTISPKEHQVISGAEETIENPKENLDSRQLFKRMILMANLNVWRKSKVGHAILSCSKLVQNLEKRLVQ